MEKNHKFISASGIFSYALSVIYLLLVLIFGEAKNINYGFVILHVIIIMLGIFMLFWIYLAVFVAFKSRKMQEPEKDKTRILLKTLPHRMALGIFYWLAPIGLYFYHISSSKYLYIFVWLPLWYPIIYYLAERYIKNKEKKSDHHY